MADLPVARSESEAYLYILLRPCERCGEAEFAPPLELGSAGEHLVGRCAGPCAGCGVRREFVFRLDLVDSGSPEERIFGDARRSSLVDPGEWLWLSDRMVATVPPEPAELAAEPRREAADHLRTAAAAVSEAIKFIPDGHDGVPYAAFTSERGRGVHAQQPGRFRRVRLEADRDWLRDSADRYAG